MTTPAITAHVRHPVPVNQLYRLEFDEIQRIYIKRGRWNHTHVINGKTVAFDGALCMAAAGAVNLNAHTSGAQRVNAGTIHDRQADRSGGIGVTDVAVAFRSFSQTLLTPDDFDRSDVIEALRERRHVTIGLNYRHLAFAEQVQKGGLFDHAISLNDVSGSMVYRFDSLDTNGRWRSIEPYLVAAEALAKRVRGTSRRLFVGVSKVRPALGIAYHVTIRPLAGHPTRQYGIYTIKNGAIVAMKTGTTKGFSALAGHRATFPWAGHPSQDLIQITSGGFAGRWIPAHWAAEI